MEGGEAAHLARRAIERDDVRAAISAVPDRNTRRVLRKRLLQVEAGQAPIGPLYTQINRMLKVSRDVKAGYPRAGLPQSQDPTGVMPKSLIETTLFDLPRAMVSGASAFKEAIPEAGGYLGRRGGELLGIESPWAETIGRTGGKIAETAGSLAALKYVIAVRAAELAGLGKRPGRAAPSLPAGALELTKELAQLAAFKYLPKLGTAGKVAAGGMLTVPSSIQAYKAAKEVEAQGGDFSAVMRAAMENGVDEMIAFGIAGRVLKAAGKITPKTAKVPQEVAGKRRPAFKWKEAPRQPERLQAMRMLRPPPGVAPKAERAEAALRPLMEAERGKIGERRAVQVNRTILANMAEAAARRGNVKAARTWGEEAGLKPTRMKPLLARAEKQARPLAAPPTPKAPALAPPGVFMPSGARPAPAPIEVPPEILGNKRLEAQWMLGKYKPAKAPPAGMVQAMGGVAAPYPPPPLPTLEKAVGAEPTPAAKPPLLTRMRRGLGETYLKAKGEAREAVALKLRRGGKLPPETPLEALEPGLVERAAQGIMRTRIGGKAAVGIGTARRLGAAMLNKIVPPRTYEAKMKAALGEEGYARMEAEKARIKGEYLPRFKKQLVTLGKQLTREYPDPARQAAARRLAAGGMQYEVRKAIEADLQARLTRWKKRQVRGEKPADWKLEEMRNASNTKYAEMMKQATRIDAADNALIPPNARHGIQEHGRMAYQIGNEAVSLGMMDKATLDRHAYRYIARHYKKYSEPGTLTQNVRKSWQHLTGKSRHWKKRKYQAELEAQAKGLEIVEGIHFASMTGLASQAQDIATGRFFKRGVLDQGLAKPKATAPKGWRLLGTPKMDARTRSRKFGPLADLYVEPNVARDIEGLVHITDPGWTGHTVLRNVVRGVKKNLVTRNPASHLRQGIGNFSPGWFTPLSYADLMDIDILRPGHWKKYVGPAKKLWKSNDPVWKEFERTGLMDTGWEQTYMKDITGAKTSAELLRALGSEYGMPGVKSPKEVGRFRRMDEKASTFYRNSDVFLKWMGYLKYRREGYKGVDAFKLVQDRTPNYNLVPDWIGKFEKSVAGRPFMAYTYDSARIFLNQIATPRGMLKFAKHMVTAAVVRNLVQEHFDISDKDLETARQAGYVSSLGVPVWQNADGSMVWYDPENVAPASSLVTMLSSIARGHPDEMKRLASEEAGDNVFSPLVLLSIFEAKIGQQDWLGRDIYKQGESFPAKVVKGLGHIAGSLVGGSYKYPIRDIFRYYLEEPGKRARPPMAPPGALLTRGLGLPLLKTRGPKGAKKALKKREVYQERERGRPIWQEVFGVRPSK